MPLANWPTILVQAALDDLPLAASPTFTTLANVDSFNLSRGRSFELDANGPGTSTVTFKNGDSRYDPINDAGPYANKLTVNRRYRIAASFASTVYRQWDGFADAWTQSLDSDLNRIAILTGTDAFKFLAKNKLSAALPWIIGDPIYGLVDSMVIGGQIIFPIDGETCGHRIKRILDLWPFPTTFHDIDDGLTLLSRDGTPRTGGSLDPNETALSYITKIRDSEDGRFHVSPNGKIVFWARDHSVLTPTQNTSQITLTDDGTGDAGYKDITIDPADDRYVRNVISRTRRDWASPVSTQDSTSCNQFGPIPDDRTIVSRYPADVVAQVARLLALYKDPHVRISQVVIEPKSNPAVLFPAVLGLDLGDRVTIKRTIAGGGTPLEVDCYIEKITHDVTARLEWTTTWQLSPADLVTTPPPGRAYGSGIYGDSTYGG